MKTLDLVQGSPEWLAVRASRHTASEAPAMMGVSKYQSRSDLLQQKATGLVPEVDAFKQRMFDRGHETEAMARELVEAEIGEELYPVVASDDAGYLLASFDGINMAGNIGFEHKLFNAELASAVRANDLPPMYYWQLEQQILVGGLDKIIFVCSDGTKDNWAEMEYRAVPGRAEALMSGWKQFDEDLANYQHVEVIPAAVSTPTLDLPAVSVQVSGSIALISNLDVFGARLGEFIAGICTEPSTDQDFADCDAAIKTLEKAEAALKTAESNALAQTASIDDMRRTVALYADQSRTMRLKIEKLVKQRKESIKVEIQQAAKMELSKHLAGLNARIGQNLVPPYSADFAGCMRGLKSINSIRDKVSVELANAKIATSATADLIEMNLKTIGDQSFLFPDLQAVCTKSAEDFAAILFQRQAAHKEAEDKKVAARVEQELAAKVAEQLVIEAANKRHAEAVERTKQAAVIADSAPVQIQSASPACGSLQPAISAKQQASQEVQRGRINSEFEIRDQIIEATLDMSVDEMKIVLHCCERVITGRQAAD